jgi:hypothetical protein
MTTTAEHEIIQASGDAPAFPPEHYRCPPWCEVQDGPVGHDSADGMPSHPNFDGYRHELTYAVPFTAAEPFTIAGETHRNPLLVSLDLDPGDTEPHITLQGEDDEDTAVLTLAEARHLAAVLGELLAAAS